jgi:peptide/nickel transport system permease protein
MGWLKLPLASKIGGGILFLYILITLAGFFFLPDSSPDANAQVPELSQLAPLSRANTLKMALPVNEKKNVERLYYKEIALAKEGKPFIRQDTLWALSYNNLAIWFLLPNVVLGIDKTSNEAEDLMRRVGKPYLLSEGKVEWWDGQKWQRTSLGELNRRFWQSHYREKIYWLGTDFYGRDVLSRLVRGGAYSLLIGLVSVFFSIFLGLGLGGLSGLGGAAVDHSIQWFMTVLWALPSLLLAIGLSFALGKGLLPLCLAIGLSIWVDLARIIRSELLSLRERDFVTAAKIMAFSKLHIFRYHLLPNLLGVILVYGCSNFGTAILLEAGLSFLGLGVAPPAPTWGNMIYEGYTYILLSQGKWLAFFPGMAMIILIIALYLLAGGLQQLYRTNH